MTSLTGCVVTTRARPGRRSSDTTSRFTSLSLSFGILPLTLMKGCEQIIALSKIFHFVFVSAKRRLFSPWNRHAGELVFYVYWLNQLDDVTFGHGISLLR